MDNDIPSFEDTEPLEALQSGYTPTQTMQGEGLGNIVKGVIGDKAPSPGDEGIRESLSPIDFVTPGMVTRPAKALGAFGKEAINAAPRIIGNEAGAVGGFAATRPNKLGLYSKLEHVIESKMGGSASPEQIMAMLKNNSVKPEEIHYSGLENLLSGKSKISKDELLSHVKSNQLPIKEVSISDEADKMEEVLRRSLIEKGYSGRLLDDAISGARVSGGLNDRIPDSLRQNAEDLFVARRAFNNKFSKYTLPGGDNYREKLFTLPEQETNYVSPHFDEPNILAHTRLKDRLDSEGKKHLFAEEIQSDWHQAGREKGYKTNKITQDYAKEFFGIKDDVWNGLTEEQKQDYVDEIKQGGSHISQGMREPVPDAPFKKTWHELVSKNLLNDAAKGGYDNVSWTTGSQQNERYNLSKFIDNLEFKKSGMVRHGPSGGGKEGYTILATDKNGNSPGGLLMNLTPQELEEHVGKDLAKHIIENATHENQVLKGAGLEVGGEGMKGFYDKMIPDYMGKIGKKFGVKPEKTILPKAGEVWTMKITPEMRKTILKEGLPLFSAGGLVMGQDSYGQNFADGGMVEPSFEDTQPLESSGDVPTWENSESLEEKYGTPGQQIITGLEGAAEGLLGPLAPAIERGIGVNPEDIRLRKEVNPIAHGGAEALSLAGSMLTGVGEAALLEKGAAALAEKVLPKVALAIEAGDATRKMRMGAAALKGAIEMTGFGVGDEITKAIIEDPHQTTQTALANIGLGTALGGVGGALFGALPAWKVKHEKAVEQSLVDFNNMVEGAVGDMSAAKPLKDIEEASLLGQISKLKPDAKEILKISEEHGLPVYPGMIGGREVEQATDALLKGPPTVASIMTRKEYDEAYELAKSQLESATASTRKMSETEVGNSVKSSLMSGLEKEYEPIKSLYEEIDPYKEAIPLSKRSADTISRNLVKAANKMPKGLERYNYTMAAAEMIKGVENLKQLSDVLTELGRNAGPYTKDIIGGISDSLKGVEMRAIERFSKEMKTGLAKDKILDLIQKSKAARGGYAAFREKLQTLGNSLGKKKIYGPQNFLDFLEDLNPQTLAKRTFNEGNTEFANYLAKEFPQEFSLIRDYQRGLNILDAKGEVLSPGKITKNILSMEPEMQKLLYTGDELKKVRALDKYIGNFPKAFNPSGTSHESAFRAFFESPTGAALGNLRDFGMRSFIDAVSRSYPIKTKDAEKLIPTLAHKVLGLPPSASSFKSSVTLGANYLMAEDKLRRATTLLFSGAAGEIVPEPDDKKVNQLSEKVDHYSDNPQDLFNLSNDLNHYMPDHGTELSRTIASGVNYLNSIKPKPIKINPLDNEIKPTKAQNLAYERNLKIAQDPAILVNFINNGTIIPEDIKTLNAIYPGYYKKMSQSLMSGMTDHVSGEGTIPYRKRQSLSLFLGQPLDSTMTPASIQAIQLMYVGKKRQIQQAAQQQHPKKNTSKLGDISKNMLTSTQKAEENRMKK